MRKFLCVFLCMLLLFCSTACTRDSGDNEATARGFSFEAVVKEVSEESILVMPVADSNEAGVAMDVGLLVMKSDKIPAVKEGNLVRIDYDGVITRSIPGRLGEVYSFEVIG